MGTVMNKSELIAELTKLGIEHDPNAKNVDLEALLLVDCKSDVPEESVPPMDAELEEEIKPEAKKANSKVKDPKGDPDVEVKPGQVKKIVNETELVELQKDGKLVGYNPATKEAVYKK